MPAPARRQRRWPNRGKGRIHWLPALLGLPGLLGLLWLLLGQGACGPAPPAWPDAVAANRLLTSQPILVALGNDWTAEAEGGGWSFRGKAKLHCYIGESGAGPLHFRLRADPKTAAFRFRLRWDDEVRSEEQTGDLELKIEGKDLAPGPHFIEIERLPPFSGNHDNRFSSMSYRWAGGAPQVLDPADADLHSLLADFLAFGVTGTGKLNHGGILITDSSQGQFQISKGRELAFEAENLGTRTAQIRVALGSSISDLSLAPGDIVPVRLPLKGSPSVLDVSARMEGPGRVLLAAPRVASAATGTAARAGKPPIFLITLDTTRRDALTPYGAPPDHTPRLQDFARRATVFERAYSTSPWTLPSHASMMTGLYPSHHGAGVSKPALQSDSTLAQLLRQAGYITAGFAGGDLCSHRFGLSRGFSFYRDPDSFETRGPQMLSYLEEFLRSQSESSPLFVFANFFDPHAPYGADPEFRSRFGVDEARRRLASDPSDPWYRIDVAYTGSLRLLFEGEVPMTEEGLSYVHGAYQAEVAFMDQQLGLFFDQLRERELFDPALIILVADHGELLGEYGGLFSHAGRLDPELTEIPLLVKWPGQRQGVKVPQLVSQVDLFATILEAAGLAVPANDGTPLPRAAAEVRRRRLFLEEHESQIHPLPPRLKLASHVYGIQLPRWRQVVWDGSGQCARLLEGRWSPEPCREAPQRVLSRLQEMLGEADRGEPVGQMSLEVEQSLRALGYL